jgi:hypothetical protein
MSSIGWRSTLAVATSALVGCEGSIIIRDDYRPSRGFLAGQVLMPSGQPAVDAVVRVMAIAPLFLQGDTVRSDADGGFRAEIGAFGVASFTATVRVESEAADLAYDTVLTDVVVREEGRGGDPETRHLVIKLRP